MSRIKKAGMLLFLLAFPAFLFLFLKFFGSNYYDLPYYYPLRDTLGGGALTAGGDTVFFRVPGIMGTDAGGNEVSASALDGRITLIGFGQFCGTEMSERLMLANGRLKKAFTGNPEVQGIFVPASGDEVRADAFWRPVRTGPAGTWDSLLGIGDQVYAGTPLPGFCGWVLVDSRRHIRGTFDLHGKDEPDRLIGEVKILLHQKEQGNLKGNGRLGD